MKNSLFTIALLLFSLISFAQTSTYVNGYTRSNGTYVQGYYRTTPNYTRTDNYSTSGNTNPYTGQAGTKSRDNYNSPSTYKSSSYNVPSYSTRKYITQTYSRPTYSTTQYKTSNCWK